jgi:RNA polymerase sigma-70 factor, ECF subfamily
LPCSLDTIEPVSESVLPSSSTSATGGTSLSLLERVRANDPGAWQRLVRLYSPLVFFWARRAGLAEADAADVVQDVWLAVAQALPRFDRKRQGGTFRGWLWTIARNKLTDHFRNRLGKAEAAGGTEARQRLETILEHEPADESGVQESQMLRRALESLRPEFAEHTWQAFWRMTVDGLPAPAVGAELGMAANAVHQAKFRVLRRLREAMAGLIDA